MSVHPIMVLMLRGMPAVLWKTGRRGGLAARRVTRVRVKSGFVRRVPECAATARAAALYPVPEAGVGRRSRSGTLAG